MEAFTLLKYWKRAAPLPTTPTQDTTAVHQNDNETTDDDDDEGPFFDLQFTVPDEEEAHENHKDDDDNNDDESESESEREFKFALSPSSNDPSDSDDILFKGNLVQLEPSSFDLNSSEPNSKPQFTASLLKSATKFRVFMSGLKKSKYNVAASDKDSKNASDAPPPPQNPKQQEPTEPQQRKLFTVKFKIEEVPIVSLFIRDSDSKGGGASANKASQKPKQQNTEESQSQTQLQSPSSASDEKRFTKEVMQKYLKMVKPLYIKVSRRYAEKLRFSGQLKVPPPQKSAPAEENAQPEAADASETGGSNVKGQKQGTLPLPAGLRVVCKHLGKSRSVPVTAPATAAALASSQRRDDSLLQQQDGIQGAILHCKRSFNAPRECESSPLPRSASDPLHEISPELSRKSTNDGKDERL